MKKSRNIILIVVLAIVVLLALAYALTDFITDLIWFNEVGYTSVFLTELFTKIKLGVPSFIIVAALSMLFLTFLKNNYLKQNNMVLDTKAKSRGVTIVSIVISIALSAFLTKLVISSLWFEILEYKNATSFEVADPLFGNDVSFYMFKLDFLQGLASCAMIIIGGIMVATLLFHTALVAIASPKKSPFEEEYEQQQTETDGAEFDPNDPINSIKGIFSEKLHNSSARRKIRNSNLSSTLKAVLRVALKECVILAILFFVALAADLFLKQFELLYSGTGVAYGAGFTDINVTLVVYRILIGLAIVSAIMVIIAAAKKKILLAFVVPALMVVVSIAGTGVASLVQNIIVAPDELSKESAYIKNNIDYTRLAYDLADIKVEEFVPTADLDKVDVLNNMETFSNIRINDFEPTEQYYNQTQAIRSYYKFNDVDVDRYYINGEYTQVFLSAREIDERKTEDSWLIRHLKYTHGYGLTLSRVDKVTSSGQPDMLIHSIPPVSQVPEISIKRPEIYYGELSNNYVITNTDETEFDYPAGESNVYCTYEGTGGINLSFFNRVLFAIKEQSLKLLISSNIDSNSKILVNRNIVERVEKIAPFLIYDEDPCIVAADGQLYWVMSAYTASSRYPYSEPYDARTNFNYIRNPIKVVIDAYNGNVDFYIVDNSDPIAQTLSKIYPGLFKDVSEMSEALQAHLLYPNTLFNIQAAVYSKYHMTNPEVFYQSEDNWAIAKDIYGQTEETMTANYFIMKLPGEESAEFVSNIAYTPSGKANLTGILAARNDYGHYGEIILYRMPKDRIIYGPAQIEAQVNQDAEISKEFALWNNSGSTYSRGDMFVIPVESSILYVEPVYLEASTGSLPEVKRVIVYYNEKLAYANTLAEALDKLFGEGSGAPLLTQYPIITGHEMADEILNGGPEDNPGEETDPTQPQDPVIDPSDVSLANLAKLAQQAYENAQASLAKGDWTGYGSYMQQLSDYINQMATKEN